MAPLTEAEVDESIAGGAWRREGDAIVRDIEVQDFSAAIALVNTVAEAAEAANHHPDILVHDYKHVRLTLSTHSEGGLTEHDIQMARAIDALTPV